MIRLFVGTDPQQHVAERALEASVRTNTSQPVEITWMRQGDPGFDWGGWGTSWATPFTMFRWYVPELCKHEGRAIYMDVDMLALADLTELWEWPLPVNASGAWAGRTSTKSDVILWQCQNVPSWPREHYLDGRHAKVRAQGAALLHREHRLPARWDHVDELHEDTAILHFSKMSLQPWKPYPQRLPYNKPHPDEKAVELFWHYAKMEQAWA